MDYLDILKVGPLVTVQDLGRQGYISKGLSRGGAMDRQAVFEGAKLLQQSPELAVIEMGGVGGNFRASRDLKIALTGAPMQARIDGQRIDWHGSWLVPRGSVLEIGSVLEGQYGYLHVDGGIGSAPVLGSRSAHLAAGIGSRLTAGMRLSLGESSLVEIGFTLLPNDRFSGGNIRIIPGPQTRFFDEVARQTFATTRYRRDRRANRTGVAVSGGVLKIGEGLSVLSDIVVLGDIQISGDGTPYILLAEHQTMGGYPRIGTVVPADLPKIVQAPFGADLYFKWVSRSEARNLTRAFWRELGAKTLVKRVSLPARIDDLLSYQLISGAITGWEEI